MWEPLCAVYATQPGLASRLAVAEIAAEKLHDPKRAFGVVRGALDLDPTGEKLLPELERLSVRAADPDGLLEVYEQLLPRASTANKLDLLRRRANVREQRQKNPSGALDELVRAFPYAPDDAPLLAEIRRLAEVTRRWDDALAVEGYRFHRAPESEKLAIACDAAAIVEEKVKDPLRAFRAYLRAFQLAGGRNDDVIRGHLWRLAAIVGEIRREPTALTALRAPPPPTPNGNGNGFVVASSKPPREPTLEVALDEVMFDESRPIPLMPRDPTMELSINDLVAIARPNPPPQKAPSKQPPTMELSLSDVAVVARGGRKKAPPPTPMPPPTTRTLQGVHSAWDELALVQLSLPAEDEAEQFRHILAVSEMWERGAGDLPRAFEALAGAFKLHPDRQEARVALDAAGRAARRLESARRRARRGAGRHRQSAAGGAAHHRFGARARAARRAQPTPRSAITARSACAPTTKRR